jgi:formate C-acetyltransferase
MGYFGDLHPRSAAIRERVLGTQPSVCTERAVYTTRAYKEHEQEQVVLRRAYMLDAVLRNMSIHIDPQGLIVGNHASADRSAPIFPEYAMDWCVAE